MYRDQWDIYKLDPAYDCLVHHFSQPSIITLASDKKEPPSPVSDGSNFTIPRPPPRPPKQPFRRRPLRQPSHRTMYGVSMTKPRKVPAYDDFSDETDDSDEESEEMKVDTRFYLHSERLRSAKAHINATRKLRREKIKKSQEKRGNTMFEEAKYDGGTPQFQTGGGQPEPGMDITGSCRYCVANSVGLEHHRGPENVPNTAESEPKQTDTSQFFLHFISIQLNLSVPPHFRCI